MKQFLLVAVFMTLLPMVVHATLSKSAQERIEQQFTPAIAHRALKIGVEKLDPSKLKTIVVLKQGGIPAGRAPYFISLGDYDYFPSEIRGDSLYKIRPLRPYTFLPAGTVMIVSKMDYRGNKLFLELLSLNEVNVDNSTHPSRVAARVGVAFDRRTIAQNNTDAIMERLMSWFTPFATQDEAIRFVDKPLSQADDRH